VKGESLNMKKIKEVVIALICILALISSNIKYTYAEKTSNAEKKLNGYTLQAENSYLKLFYNSEERTLAIVDKRNDHVWFSAPDENYLLKSGVEEFFLRKFKALWTIKYNNLAGQDSAEKLFSSTSSDIEESIEKISNGFRIKYYIPKLSFKFAIEFVLDKDSLIVRIPANQIQEMVQIKEQIDSFAKEISKKFFEAKNIMFKKVLKTDIYKYVIKQKLDTVLTDIKNMEGNVNSINDVESLNFRASQISSLAFDAISELTTSEKGKGIIDILKTSKMKNKENTANLLTKIVELLQSVKDYADNLRVMEVAGITGIDVLPYFGSAGDDQEGYVVIPDGCGAISYFKKVHPQYVSYYSKEVYTMPIYELDEYKAKIESGMQEVSLPVIGVKVGNGAFIATVTKSEADSVINFLPSGYEVNLNRAFFSFIYRRPFMSVTKNYNADYYLLYPKEIEKSDKEIRYIFLADKEANYSGMANRYRSYLLEKQLIRKSKLLTSNYPLGLDLFMGIKEKRLLFDKFIVMTTYSQAIEIIKSLRKDGVINVQTNLIGWSAGGYDVNPMVFAPEGKLGGESEFKSLINFAKSAGINMFLQCNLIDANKDSKGFSVRTDVARARNGKQITNKKYTEFLISPEVVLSKYIKNLKVFDKKYSIKGVAFEKLTSFVYTDYRNRKMYTKEITQQIWQKVLENLRQINNNVAAIRANQYAFRYVDRIINAPYKSTGYFYFDHDIPFYQMVIHGLIPYSLKPFNLFYDYKMEKLKAIEYGAMPYFQITYNDPSNLKYTSYSELFTSKFSVWKNEIVKAYKEFSKVLNGLNDKFIISHNYIDKEFVEVLYSDGTRIFINYSNKPKTVNKVVVPPFDYKIIRKWR